MAQVKNSRTTRSQSKRGLEEKTPEKQNIQKKERSYKKGTGQKRKVRQQGTLLNMGFKKQQKDPIVQPKIHLYSIKELLKDVSIETLMEKCPKVQQFYNAISMHSSIDSQMVLTCLDKYFHGSSSAQWEHKYAPRSINEILQNDFGRKVQQWIKDFYLYRTLNYEQESDLSFIDDDSFSKSIQQRMQDYGWNCIGLVLKGRSGSGKFALLNALAKSMKFTVFEFSSDSDQLLKLKEQIKGSSESQCVHTIMNKKKQQQKNKIRRQNKSIFNFMQNEEERQNNQIQSKMPKRMQVFRDFTIYYPNDDRERQNAEQSYIRYLLDAAHNSTIPYILTTNKQQFPLKQSLTQKISKLDTIQFEEPTIEELTNLYWIILQIQTRLFFRSFKQIEPGMLYEELNEQLKDCNLDQQSFMESHAFIREIIMKANKKIRYISKYLQYVVFNELMIFNKLTRDDVLLKQLEPTVEEENAGIKNLEMEEQNESKEIRRIKRNKQKFGSHPFKQVNNKNLLKLQRQIIKDLSPERLIYDIDWELIDFKEPEINPLEQTADGQSSDKSSELIDNLDKYLIGKQQKHVDIVHSVHTKKTLKQMRYELEVAVIEDNRHIQQYYYWLNHERQNAWKEQEEQETLFMQVPIKTHRNARKIILKNINKKRIQKGKNQLNIEPINFYMLPMLLAPKRLHRLQRRPRVQETLEQLMDRKEAEYMKKFNKFMKVF